MKNSEIRILSNFFQYPDDRDFFEFLIFGWSRRYLGELTFAINFKLHELSVTGYHIINILIHIVNAILVYVLVSLTLRASVRKQVAGNQAQSSESTHRGESALPESPDPPVAGYVALFSALLFAVHPLQTQAVTYIVQRFASLATLFYLLCLVLYIRFRLSTSDLPRFTFYALSLISAVFAMKTKEISFTLPFSIILYEFMFFRKDLKKRIIYLIPFALTAFIIPFNLIGIDRPLGEAISDVTEQTRIQTAMSRWDYLITQFNVITTYVRLLFLPINQNLDYDYPQYYALFTPKALFSLALLLGIMCLSVFLYFRSRRGNYSLRIISFGLFWFLLTLSIESSVIPIIDVIFEHRMYLPSVGAFIALSVALFYFFLKLQNRWRHSQKALLIVCFFIILGFSCTTYARNTIWKDEITLWEDVVSKSPGKARGHNNLGEAAINQGKYELAFKHLQTALRLKPNYPEAHNNIGIYYASKGVNDKALKHYLRAVKLWPNFAEGHMNVGFAYFLQGNFDEAIEHLEKSVQLDPNNAKTHLNLGIAYKSKGLISKANEHKQRARSLEPDLFRATKKPAGH